MDAPPGNTLRGLRGLRSCLLVDEGASCAEFTAIIGADPIDFASVFVFHFYTKKTHTWTNQSGAPFQPPHGPEIRRSGVLQGVIGRVQGSRD